MKTLIRAIVCWWVKKCRRYAPMHVVHHHHGSIWFGYEYGWYEKSCSNRSCVGWIEPIR